MTARRQRYPGRCTLCLVEGQGNIDETEVAHSDGYEATPPPPGALAAALAPTGDNR